MAGRVRHPIDITALERYIDKNVPEIKTPLDVKQFGFGQSNPTYQITSRPTGTRYVLRKKPPGTLLSNSAHKVEREHRILRALGGGATDVPVPRTYGLCEDAAVLGTPFYIMEFLDGRIIEDASMPDARGADERAELWRQAIVTLARLHAVDHRSPRVGLRGYGRDVGFYDRQVATWRAICDAQARAVDAESGVPVGPIPHFDGLLRFFSDRARQPADRASLVHGDYKIDNLVFHATEPRVIGILDWEMSTVGHPLSDLANLLHPFYAAAMPVKYSSSTAFAPGTTPGLPTPETALRWYTEASGWDPRPDMGWAVAFSVFRLSAICQGIAARVATGQASSEQARQHAQALGPLADFAWELVQREERQIALAAKL